MTRGMIRWTLTVGLALALLLPVAPVAGAAADRVAGEVAATTRIQKATADNLCLAAFSRDPGSIVVQWSCAGPTEPTQVWDFIGPYYVPQGGHYWLVRNRHSGLCLTNEQNVAGAPVVQQPCSTVEPPPNTQAWGISTGGRQMIISRQSQQVGATHLYVTVSGPLSGARAELRPLGPSPVEERSFRFLDATFPWY